MSERVRKRKKKERTMHMTARDKGAEWKYGRRDMVTVAESSAAGPGQEANKEARVTSCPL